MSLVGGFTEVKDFANSIVIDDLARFAVDEYNKKQNTLLEFRKVLNAKEQIVSGTLYYITLDAANGGIIKTYEAKVWVKKWENFKELQEFKPVDAATSVIGGITEVKDFANSLEIEDLARFAVDEHNKKQNTLLEFGKVLNAKEQIVAGKLCYITLEATDGGVKKTYEAKVWVKPWENFKELQEFKPVDAATPVIGGITEVKDFANSLVIDDLARFAVDEYSKKQNTLLEFERVLDAKQQIVAGTMYYFILEATVGGVKNTYVAKVLLKPDNSKELKEFKHLY
ncbi:putative Cystatin domain-containing protein [Helianthus annuus]|uniref:Cysteine proteinase inhibitor n=1 Tax=Helianthus annuus TaxID=4232 RepID=A0A251VBC4_HELAN|nr:multicystatin-like [Helianthus annuus]KAF5816513.1 putative Cystatin domain-containing protein [Helianthus annuus]